MSRTTCCKCGIDVLDGFSWCESCGPPTRHAEGCDCNGCAELRKLAEQAPEAAGVLPMAIDFFMSLFGGGDRKVCAETRLVQDLFECGAAVAAGEKAPPPVRGEAVNKTAVATARARRMFDDPRVKRALREKRGKKK